MPLDMAAVADTAGGVKRDSEAAAGATVAGPMAKVARIGEGFAGKDAEVAVVSWNVAAVNNNPFEYWITHDDPKYDEFMRAVQGFVDSPHGASDVTVGDVFTDAMFEALIARMAKEPRFEGMEQVREFWTKDLKERKIVSGFLKDKSLGSKRVISMPDRITNTMSVVDSKDPVCRPAVINAYEGALDSVPGWWTEWQVFVFESRFHFGQYDPSSLAKDESKTRVLDLLKKIPRHKYPALSEEEERISLPLQVLCLAAFDAVTVHLSNAAAFGKWHPIKLGICGSLMKDKAVLCVRLLEDVYGQADVIALQEVGGAFLSAAKAASLGRDFHVLVPANYSSIRAQNSVVLLRKSAFSGDGVVELTDDIEAAMPEGSPKTEPGDLCIFKCRSTSGSHYIVGSFHADTSGLCTLPFVRALAAHIGSRCADARVVLGMDANTYNKVPKPGARQGVREFFEACKEVGLTSCFGDEPSNTTFNARTFLQPQLNKAVPFAELATHQDTERNPKDHILFSAAFLKSSMACRDNTGKRRYEEDMVFPTLAFPSDHAIISTTLV